MRQLLISVPLILCALVSALSRDPEDQAKPGEEVVFFSGLGMHSRAVDTSNPVVQKLFDQGLAFLFAYNHDEAIASFEQAASLDPECAMARWGIAIANGGHINRPTVAPERAKQAYDAAVAAKARSNRVHGANRLMIEALTQRYTWPLPGDCAPLDRAYSLAMKEAWRNYPKDADVGALYAESMMNLRP